MSLSRKVRLAFTGDPRTKKEIAQAQARNKARDEERIRRMTPSEKARARNYALKVIREKNYPYKKGAYEEYKALGGKLTYQEIISKKRKDC